MSATNVICQPRHKCVHLLTDGASYDSNGVLSSINSKAYAVAHWPGVMGSRGSALGGALVQWELAKRFQNFDALIAGVEAALPKIVTSFNLSEHHVELVIAGWSSTRQSPEAYVIETTENLPLNLTQAERDAGRTNDASGAIYSPPPYSLLRLPNVVTGPTVTDDMVIAASWEGIDPDAHPDDAVAALRKIVEMQRHDVRADGRHWVGGFAQVVTVTPDQVSQRIIHRWGEDTIGDLIKPSAIVWSDWNAKRGGATPSRLQRERMDKKKRKGELRVVRDAI